MASSRMIRVGNAPCSWGVIENVGGERVTYRTVLDEIAATGYQGSELGDRGFMPTDAGQLREEFAARGLQLIGSWVSVHLHVPQKWSEDVDLALQTARLLADVGGEHAVVILGNDPHTDRVRTQKAGRITAADGLDDHTWAAFAEGADRLAYAVREECGLQTVFHPHIATYVETPEEIARLLHSTDPDLLGLALDTAHIAYGGGDPLEILSRFGSRVHHVHFKGYSHAAAERCRRDRIDGVTAVSRGVFCELSDSDVAFPSILKALRDLGYEGWIVVEQDVLPGTGTPRENALRNRDYLRSIGL